MEFLPEYKLDDLTSVIALQQEVIVFEGNPRSLMELICTKAQILVGATGAVVELAEGNEMVYHAASGTLKDSIGLRLNLHASLTGTAVKTGKILYSADTSEDPRVDYEACKKAGINSMVCVPLKYKKINIGVLKVSSEKPNSFSQKDINILSLVTGLLSTRLAHIKEEYRRVRYEKVLEKSELEARRASKAKSEFLSHMSHEIRTPLNGIIGIANLISETNLTKEQKSYMEMLHSSADILLSLVNDILDISKIEAGKITLEKINFNIRDLLKEIDKLLTLNASKKGIQLNLELSQDLPEFVLGDPTRLKQILINLTNNAIKFTDRGSVTIRVGVLNSNVDDIDLKFEVQDTGIGMPAEAKKKMFLAFSQADKSTTRKYGGTGLGLSISKKLVKIMDGEIGFYSTENIGSTFWFKISLPRGENMKQERGFDKPDYKTLPKNLKILVAEDNKINAMIVEKMLKKLKCKYDTASNGKEVLSFLKNKKYNLILMDCQMPEMDGFEATREIRKLPSDSFQQIPIIALSASVLKGDRDDCIRAGMNDYLSKPVKIEDLSQTILKWI